MVLVLWKACKQHADPWVQHAYAKCSPQILTPEDALLVAGLCSRRGADKEQDGYLGRGRGDGQAGVGGKG